MSSDFEQACRAIHAVAPHEWEAFKYAFSSLTAERVDAVSEASAEHIMEQKGRALACKGLLKVFQSIK